MPSHAIHAVVHGRVQGVGFRFFARQQAVKYRLSGWVRNLPDGTVELHAEGDSDRIDAFLDEIANGPMFGFVTNLDIDRPEPTGKYDGFHIAF